CTHTPPAGAGWWSKAQAGHSPPTASCQWPAGVAAQGLWRSADPIPQAPGAVQQPVQLTPRQGEGAPRWRLGNGLLSAELGAEGVLQLWDAEGQPQLAEPLQWCRWRDHGEFWDAWDIAADYRDHPLPLTWDGVPELAEQGPLCTRLVWRGRCGRSALRLDVQLRAACPSLELQLQVDWRQRHELLRLEIPLAQPAVRVAADTAGGVLERPAQPATPRERARWEVPAVSWLASQAGPGMGGLAVLLDGPQGVSGEAERLGVSLLRAPTWPDPSADNGLQRLRLALMPCGQGWRQQAVPQAARRFREPPWLRPAQGVVAAELPVGGPFGGDAVQLIAMRPLDGPGAVWITLQNLSPQRQRLCWPAGWQVQAESEDEQNRQAACLDQLRPWQLARFRVSRLQGG
ncbi:MAG: glycoside hydrolase family 38 C-terminal domain-containing protein, partial [Vulcanococcus sp.]